MSELLTTLGSAELIGTVIFGADFLLAPIRFPTYALMRRKGYTRHKFVAHIRRDIGTITNYCDKCNAHRRNWIHIRPETDGAALDDPGSVEASRNIALYTLETEDIKWRFANDPEWVAVFGDEYDPKTGEPIPQFHNGECGGPHDSCERCAWEADQKEAEEKRDMERRNMEYYAEKRNASDAEKKLNQQEIDGYIDILWTIWNTCHDHLDALDEFEDIQDELGMMKHHVIRDKVRESEPYKRIIHCLNAKESVRWKRREEYWHRKVKSDSQRIRRYYDDF